MALHLGRAASVQAGDSSTDALRDTARVRFEFGASTDYANEIYYLDALVDTTFLKRQRFDTPQARYAGVVSAALRGTRGGRTTSYSLLNEVSVGDRLRRAVSAASWRSELASDWQVAITPRFEYRWDRTLDRNLDEYLATGTARLRRNSLDRTRGAEVGAQAEWLRTTGDGSDFLLDRQAVGLIAGFEQAGFGGGEWRAEYAFRVRGFPDSTSRDHLEHGAGLRGRLGWGEGHSAAGEIQVLRRGTLRIASTSLDNFWEARAVGDLVLGAGDRWAMPTRLELEAHQYEFEDSLIYFDYSVLRVHSGWRARPLAAWSLTVGPRAEWLWARLDPGESYREVAGYVDFEWIGLRTLWGVASDAGWRHYTGSAVPPGDTSSEHSPFGFVDLDLIADQPLGAAWRVRLTGSGRVEFHTESIEDAGSLYFSVDVRRLF